MIHNILITCLSWNQIVPSLLLHILGGNEPGNKVSKIVGIV